MAETILDNGDKLVFTFEDGAWDIYTKDRYVKVATGKQPLCKMYAYHAGCKTIHGSERPPMNCWYANDLDQQCILCNDKVPDEIQTLIYLGSF